MGGTDWVSETILMSDVVRQTGTYQLLILCELDGSMSRRGQALSDACAAAGFEGDFSANVLLPRNFSRSCRSRASIRSPACHWASRPRAVGAMRSEPARALTRSPEKLLLVLRSGW